MREMSWKAILAVLSAGLCTILGAWNAAMTTLVILIALDIVSGWSRAFVQQQLSSKESLRGTFKKVLIFVAVALAAQADNLAGTDGVVRNAVVIFYCASEGLSVVENVVAAGMPVPDFLREALVQLNEKKASPRAQEIAHAERR
jgi:toxin secretion/phage lysis holin